MRRRRFLLLALFVMLGVLIWQLPALLKAIPSRYVAAYLPEPLQALAEREHVEMLPTVDKAVDASALLEQAERRPVYDLPPTVEAGTSPSPSPTLTTFSLQPVETSQPSPTPKQEPTIAPTSTPVPIPQAARLGALDHHFQTWNNCGPATVAMALSFFDVRRSQDETAAFLKPDPEDRNVSPYEIEDYVNNETDLAALSRTNGDMDILRRLLAGGYPVMIELGLDPPGEYRWMGWYGHYLLVVAYDDLAGQVWVYDSWFGTSDVPGENANAEGRQIKYEDLDYYWRQFGRNYIAFFDPAQQADVTQIIGPAMDDETMWLSALDRARSEISLEEDDAFMWFNLGTAFNALGEHEKATAAFDQARAIGLPWRMLWYQFGPYEAYYEAGRYEDVVLLADVTLQDRPYFEESYYYRGLAQAALGAVEQAESDLEKAVKRNPYFAPATVALQQLTG